MTNEYSKLLTLTTDIRDIFLNAIHDTLSTNSTEGTCAYACFFAKQLFEKFTDYQVVYRGGDGLHDGGYLDSHGELHGHYWLEVTTPDDCYIVDITADQFGDVPMVIMPIATNKQYRNGHQATVEQHLFELNL